MSGDFFNLLMIYFVISNFIISFVVLKPMNVSRSR